MNIVLGLDNLDESKYNAIKSIVSTKASLIIKTIPCINYGDLFIFEIDITGIRSTSFVSSGYRICLNCQTKDNTIKDVMNLVKKRHKPRIYTISFLKDDQPFECEVDYISVH